MERDGDWWFQFSAIDQDTTDFDIAFWQAQGPEAIFRAAWDMVELAWVLKGRALSELKMDRSAGEFKELGCSGTKEE